LARHSKATLSSP